MPKATTGCHVVGHIWQSDRVRLHTVNRAAGRVTHAYRELNFTALNIASDGLLAHSIRDATAPLQNSEAWVILRALRIIAPANPEFRRILGSNPATLHLSNISTLFTIVDAHFAAKQIKSKAATAEVFRGMILNCQTPIAGGMLVQQTSYKSTLKVPKRVPRKDITSSSTAGKAVSTITPVQAIYVQDESSFKELVTEHYAATIEPIMKQCMRIMQMHVELQGILSVAKDSRLPTTLTKKNRASLKSSNKGLDHRVFVKQSSHDQLIIAMAVIRKNKLWTNAPRSNLLPPRGIALIDELSDDGSVRAQCATLLSLFYLSRQVVMACFIVMLIQTRWNSETLISLTPKNIIRTAHGYEIKGIKSKTDQPQSTGITFDDHSENIEESAAVTALELLLWHNQQIDLHAIRRHSSIFVSMSHKYHSKIVFDVHLAARYFHLFTSKYQLPRFTASDIRPNSERHHFLKNGMHIEDSRVTLHHKKASTSSQYVAGEIASAINEAIVIRYGAMLARAIVFQYDAVPVSGGYSQGQIKTIQHLLLPPTRFSSNTDDYLIDKWLADPEDFAFNVGRAEVEQCVRQRKYYLSNLHSLRRANPERFCHSELPRIIVCIALYNIIQESPFRQYAQQLDKT